MSIILHIIMLVLYVWHRDINFLFVAGLYAIAAEVSIATYNYKKRHGMLINQEKEN